jgi:Flp pilus assembly protein TadD
MRSTVFTLALVLSLGAVAACGGAGQHGKEASTVLGENTPRSFHRAMSLTLLRTEQYRRAIPHIRQLLRLEPEAAEPPYLMARAYLGLGISTAARDMLRTAVKRAPDMAPAHALLGMLHDGLGEHQAAQRAHRRALALAPENAAFHNNLGFSLFLRGQYRSAIAAYETALRLDPGLRRVHNNLGFSHGRLGQIDRAAEHFRKGGSAAEADNNLGLVHEELGQTERAYERFLAAIQADPGLSSARLNLERVCLALGRAMPELPAPPPVRNDEGD